MLLMENKSQLNWQFLQQYDIVCHIDQKTAPATVDEGSFGHKTAWSCVICVNLSNLCLDLLSNGILFSFSQERELL